MMTTDDAGITEVRAGLMPGHRSDVVKELKNASGVSVNISSSRSARLPCFSHLHHWRNPSDDFVTSVIDGTIHKP